MKDFDEIGIARSVAQDYRRSSSTTPKECALEHGPSGCGSNAYATLPAERSLFAIAANDNTDSPAVRQDDDLASHRLRGAIPVGVGGSGWESNGIRRAYARLLVPTRSHRVSEIEGLPRLASGAVEHENRDRRGTVRRGEGEHP